MNKIDYVEKVNGMINESIQQDKYEMTTDRTHQDLEKLQSFFFYRNFENYPSCDDMRLVYKRPAKFFATAKTSKFDDYSLVNVNNLKLRPITDQSNTFTYVAKMVSDYL